MRIAVVKKKPAEKFAVGFKYSTADIQADATIASVTAIVSRSDGEIIETDDLEILGSPAKDDRTVSAMLQKGQNGLEYYVTFNVTTSTGQVFQDKIFVKVRS